MNGIRRPAFAAAFLSLLVSLLVLYVKLHFWGGTRYAPFHVRAAIWFVIAAGPLALWLIRKKPLTSLVIAVLQIGLVSFASI